MEFIDGSDCQQIQKSIDYHRKWMENESDSDGNDIDDDDIVNNVEYTVKQIDLNGLLEQIMAAIKVEANFGCEQYYKALIYLKFILGNVQLCVICFTLPSFP